MQLAIGKEQLILKCKGRELLACSYALGHGSKRISDSFIALLRTGGVSMAINMGLWSMHRSAGNPVS